MATRSGSKSQIKAQKERTMFSMMRVVLAALMSVWIGGVALAEAPGSVELKFAPEVGRVEYRRMVTKTVGSMQMPPPMGEQKMSQTMEQLMRAECIRINEDGSVVYEISTPELKMDMVVGGIKQSFDSRAAKKNGEDAAPSSGTAPGPDCAMLKAMTEIRYHLIRSPEGEPIRMEGYAEAMRKAMEEVRGQSPVLDQMLEMMSKSFDDETILKMLKSSMHSVFRKAPVRVGESWKQADRVKFPFGAMEMDVDTEYKLVGVEPMAGRSCAKILITRTMRSQPNAASENPMAQFMDMKLLDSNGEGVMWWDIERGDPVRMKEVTNMTMEMSVKNPAATQPAESVNVGPMVQKLQTSTTVDLVDPPPADERTEENPAP